MSEALGGAPNLRPPCPLLDGGAHVALGTASTDALGAPASGGDDVKRIPLPILCSLLAALAVGALVAGLSVGAGDLGNEARRGLYLSLRATRFAAAFLAGAALAVSGVMVQGLFRNPLASPSILGTSGGAMLGGQLSLLGYAWLRTGGDFGFVSPDMLLPMGCMFGALLSLILLIILTRNTTSLLTVILTGFVLSSLFVSMSGFVTALAQESWEVGRAVVAFSLGTVSGASVDAVLFAAPLVLVGIGAAYAWGRPLDVLLSGEEEAATLGVDVGSVRVWVAIWVSVLVGAAISLGGSISFVGLIVPHALRPFTGVDHRRLIPAAALFGGVFVVFCDVIARVLPARSEVPLGVVTGLIGAPIFMLLLLRAYREGHRAP